MSVFLTDHTKKELIKVPRCPQMCLKIQQGIICKKTKKEKEKKKLSEPGLCIENKTAYNATDMWS